MRAGGNPRHLLNARRSGTGSIRQSAAPRRSWKPSKRAATRLWRTFRFPTRRGGTTTIGRCRTTSTHSANVTAMRRTHRNWQINASTKSTSGMLIRSSTATSLWCCRPVESGIRGRDMDVREGAGPEAVIQPVGRSFPVPASCGIVIEVWALTRRPPLRESLNFRKGALAVGRGARVLQVISATGGPRTSIAGWTPRPGASEALMQPSLGRGQPSARLTVT